LSYCAIESFGSVMVSLFWSFANSNFSLETAKASYGVMVAFAQVGSIIGPTIVSQYAATIGVAKCYLIGACCMILLQFTMYFYVHAYGTQDRSGGAAPAPAATKKKKKSKAGILEGLQLFWDHNYVKGIFAISCLFMVEVTIIDFTMKILARDYFASLHPCEVGMSCYSTQAMGMSQDATAAFTAFMGLFGQVTNSLSFLFSLFGTSAVIRYLGLRLTLLLFPSLCLCVIICVRLKPTLYVVFSAMMILKASSYALNNPTKEMLYQPTAPSVKYKAKSWIDIFGARGSKALGSVVTNAFSDSAANLVANGSLVGMAVASFLIWNARFMGKKFDEYTASGHVVGLDEDGEVNDHVQLSQVQEEKEDTSCAIDDAADDDDGGGDEEKGEEESKAEVAMV
jgi:ATP:ADP antiporter, AAA family